MVVAGREPKTGVTAVPDGGVEVIGTGGTVELREMGGGEKAKRFGGFWPPERGEGRGGNWRGSGGSGGSGWGGEWLRLPTGIGGFRGGASATVNQGFSIFAIVTSCRDT